MAKYLLTLTFLLLASAAAACTSDPPPTATVPAPAATDPVPTEQVSSPTPLVPTHTPIADTPAAEVAIEDEIVIENEVITNTEVLMVEEDGSTAVDAEALDDALSQIDSTGLSEDEVNNLLFMREEEKLAHDVYQTLYEQWGLPIFRNIASSELTHTTAVMTLLVRYDLPDPAQDNALGVFTNSDLQALYDQLVAQGSQSLIAALQVGATIEDLDIVDLQTAIGQTDNADIILVYENLMKGSRNHLRSFVGQLQKRNGDYQPQYLDRAAYDAIINSPAERGR